MRIVILAFTFALALATALLAAQDEERPAKALPPDVGDGRIAWFDLTTTDLPRAKAFYTGLFGWEFSAVDGSDMAAEIVAGGVPIGTLRVAEGALSPYNGVVYVQVADARASCAKAAELGAMIPPGFPFDLPDGRGAIGLALDPTGHPVGIYSRTRLAKDAPAGK